MSGGHDDCRYWRLTAEECADYHDRVRRYRVRRWGVALLMNAARLEQAERVLRPVAIRPRRLR